MSEIIKYQPKLPVVNRWQLSKNSNHMDYIAKLAIEALGEQSNVYCYTVFEVLKTMNTIVALKQAFSLGSLTPETEAMLQNLTQNYLQEMQKIPQEACEMIIQVLKKASASPNDKGLLGAVIDAFMNRRDR